MGNLAFTYELQGDLTNANQAYQKLLQHDPGNADLRAKIRELRDKR